MNIPGTPAAVTGTHKNELMLFFTLLELTLIIVAGRIGGALAKRGGQSTSVGEIIIGIALGPSLFGLLAPHAFDYVFHSAPPEPLTILSNLGLVLLMFQIGLEFDFAHLTERVNRAAVLRVSTACLALPFACGFILGLFVAENASPAARINTALFVATAFSITAVPILGRIMMDVILCDEAELGGAGRVRLGDFVPVFFLPIYFTYTGLRTSIGGLEGWGDWGLCLGIVAAASLAKLGGGYLAARRSGLNHPGSAVIAYMMNNRGLMELILIHAWLDPGLISA